MNDSKKNEGFTAADLLALLTTLGVLVLLVLPFLAKAGDHGARTICLNNLRQLGVGVLGYANDNRDYLPYPNWGNLDQGWLYTPENGRAPVDTGTGDAYKTGLVFPYVRNTSAYVCPADRESRYYLLRQNRLSSYVMNGAVCGYGSGARIRTMKVSQVWNAECFLMWTPSETTGDPSPIGAFAFNDAASYPGLHEGMGRLHTPHAGEVLSVSGYARSVTARKFAAEQSAPNRSLTWWSGFRADGR